MSGEKSNPTSRIQDQKTDSQHDYFQIQGQETSVFGSQHHYFPPEGQPNPSFPTVEVSDVPEHRRSHMNVAQGELHSLDLSLISNQ